MPAIADPVPILLLARELGAGGSERQLVTMARALAGSRFQPHVAYFRDGMRVEELQQAGIPCLHLPVTSFRNSGTITQARRLFQFLKEKRIRLVHSFDYPTCCFAVPLARAAGVPAVVSSQRGHRDLIPRGYYRAVRMTDLAVDAIVANCRAMQRHLIEDEEVPLSKTALCYSGLKLSEFARQPSPARPAGWPADAIVVGCVAVLRPEKNLDLLVRAFAAAHAVCSQMRLLLVGSGPGEAKLREVIRDLRVGNFCFLQSATKDVAPWLNQMDIFVLPSQTEALSNSLMEAMACECAVIASDVGGNPELVDGRQTGLLFRAGDERELHEKLVELGGNPLRRRKLGENARTLIAEKFSVENSGRTLRNLYEAILSGLRMS